MTKAMLAPRSAGANPAAAWVGLMRRTLANLLLHSSALGRRIRAARSLHAAGNFEAALAAYEALHEVAPGNARISCGVASCALALGQVERAREVIGEALALHPDEPAVIAEAAQVQERQALWHASIGNWEKIVRAPLPSVYWQQRYAHNLIVLGRFDEAETLLRTWLGKYPDHQGLLAVEALLASDRSRWDEAVALWRAYRQRFPDDRTGWEHYGRAYQARQLASLDHRGHREPAVPATIEQLDDPAACALLMEFESIGHDCEFGLVQRRFGAEPLGLLRFNAVGFGELLAAVANRFERMGEPELTEMVVSSNGEFYVADSRWGLGMHSFVYQGQADRDRLREKLCRRVAYLRDRFLEDRAEGRKIMVFTHPGLGREDLAVLHAALRSLGHGPLLHVVFGQQAGEGLPAGEAGTVDDLGDGLYVGHVGRAGRTPALDWDIAYDDWLEVCRRTRSLLAAG